MPVSAQPLNAANTSAYMGDGRWNWKIFIQAPDDVIRNIDCVEYTLHPTFDNPIKKICDVGDVRYPFAYSANGWGTFNIPIIGTMGIVVATVVVEVVDLLCPAATTLIVLVTGVAEFPDESVTL